MIRTWKVLLILVCCREIASPASPLAYLKGNPGGEVIEASLQAMGGWDAWARKKDVQYDRESIRFEADGRVTYEKQIHRFLLPPSVKVRQESIREETTVVTGFDGVHAWVLENGKSVTDPARLRGARNSSFGTQYMFCVPWKLVDGGAHFEKLDPITVGNKIYDRVRVTYAPGSNPGSGDNPDHVWTFYFNRQNHFLERLDWSNAAGTSHSISEYGDYRKIDGLWWPNRRINYEKDPKGDRGRKTSELIYRNILFDNRFDPVIFRSPAPTN